MLPKAYWKSKMAALFTCSHLSCVADSQTCRQNFKKCLYPPFLKVLWNKTNPFANACGTFPESLNRLFPTPGCLKRTENILKQVIDIRAIHKAHCILSTGHLYIAVAQSPDSFKEISERYDPFKR